jgi:hypothetical protein
MGSVISGGDHFQGEAWDWQNPNLHGSATVLGFATVLGRAIYHTGGGLSHRRGENAGLANEGLTGADTTRSDAPFFTFPRLRGGGREPQRAGEGHLAIVPVLPLTPALFPQAGRGSASR